MHKRYGREQEMFGICVQTVVNRAEGFPALLTWRKVLICSCFFNSLNLRWFVLKAYSINELCTSRISIAEVTPLQPENRGYNKWLFKAQPREDPLVSHCSWTPTSLSRTSEMWCCNYSWNSLILVNTKWLTQHHSFLSPPFSPICSYHSHASPRFLC